MSSGAPTGETDLARLLAAVRPRLDPRTWTFCTTADEARARELAPDAIGVFREDEGVTLILESAAAERASLAGAGAWSRITCEVHSSLEAVGFLAALSRELAAAGIPCNAVAGYYHDHLFVPRDRAAEALALLEGGGAG